jgi:hypothetical protein
MVPRFFYWVLELYQHGSKVFLLGSGIVPWFQGFCIGFWNCSNMVPRTEVNMINYYITDVGLTMRCMQVGANKMKKNKIPLCWNNSRTQQKNLGTINVLIIILYDFSQMDSKMKNEFDFTAY